MKIQKIFKAITAAVLICCLTGCMSKSVNYSAVTGNLPPSYTQGTNAPNYNQGNNTSVESTTSPILDIVPGRPAEDTTTDYNKPFTSEYEDMDIFEEAKKLGYEVQEFKLSLSKYYYVCFTYNGASFLISSAHEPSGDILFYGKEMTEKDLYIGTFGFLTFTFSDGGDASRDNKGHWNFSADQKKQLMSMFSNFKESGPSSFIDCCNKVGKRYLSSDLKALVEEMNLKIAYHYVNGGYRFLVSDGKNLAWFAAIYSEADFRPNDKAFGLNTYVYGENQYSASGFLSSSFLTDYVDKNGRLNSESERVDQLRDFFNNCNK